MKLNLLIIILINIGLFAHGGGNHSHHRQSIGSIYGSVVDSLNNSPIEYVSVSLISKNSNEIVSGNITDTFGKFRINDINPGEYYLKLEFMGYLDKTISNIKISPRRNPQWDAGIIKLQQSMLEMDEVTIIDKKPIFEFETDKMIYNSSDDIVAGSGTAEDVLNKVPMVTVDQDGEVSLRGNPNVKILINGRQNRTGGEVDNIPASLIDRVEIITSPSAKYDPEGMAGIINIVLKKGRFEGFNGTIKFNAKHNSFNSVDKMNGTTFYSNYQTDKYNIYSSFSINNRMRTQNGFREVFNKISDSTYYDVDGYKYDFNNDGDGYSRSFIIGSDYSINENLKVNGELSYKNNSKTKIIKQEYYQDGVLDTNYIEFSNEGDYDGNFHLESFFELIKTYDNPDKEISLSFSSHRSIDNEYEEQNPFITNVNEKENHYEADFNYKTPLNEKSKLEIGYDGRFINTNEILNFELSGLDGINNFNMLRNIHGFFGEYQIEFSEKFSIKPSLRIEFVDKNIEFAKKESNITDGSSVYGQLLIQTDDTLINLQETNYFPDFHLTYNLTKKQNIQFGISKRIERPAGGSHGSWGQLRPFPRNVYNDSFIFIGNPFLKPEFSTQYEISYKGPMPMGFFYTNLYYRDVKNSIEWYDYDGIENDLTGNIITFKNAEGGKDIGAELFMMIMGQTIGGGYNVNELNDSSNDFQLNGKNERMNMYMRVNFPEEYIKIFGFEFGFYYMKIKTPGGTLFGSKGTIWANTGISKSLMENRLNISFSIDNIFDQGGFQMYIYEPVTDSQGVNALQYSDVYSSRGGRTFSISMKYNFGKMQDEQRKGRGQGFRGTDGGGMDMGY